MRSVQDGEKQNGADTVVEEGFAGELGLNVLRDADAMEHFKDRDRVGR